MLPVLISTLIFWLAVIFGGMSYILIRQRKGIARLAQLQQSGALNRNHKARLVVYSSLASIDGQPLDGYIPLLGRKPEAFMDAVLLLVEPGEHSFEVKSVQLGEGDTLFARLEAGHSYQIGANSERNYIVPDNADYSYKRVIASRKSLKAGLVNTLF